MPAKRKARRKRVRLIKGNVDEELALVTLADSALISTIFDENVEDRSFILSLEGTWTKRGGTPGEGPLIIGVAHSDYSSTEIEEVIENTGSWAEGDLVAQEIGRRKVRIIGSFPQVTEDEVLNDGKPIKTALKFILNQGDSLKLFAYNKSRTALTTGSVLIVSGHVWIKPT